MQNIQPLQPNKRNIIIEVLRIFACFWVLYYHNFLTGHRSAHYFSAGYLAVQKGLFRLIWLRFQKMLPYMSVSIFLMILFGAIAYNKGCFVMPMFAGITYWWYIFYMFLVFAVLFLLRLNFQHRITFNLVVLAICIASYFSFFNHCYDIISNH